jgi:hypothetical protein
MSRQIVTQTDLTGSKKVTRGAATAQVDTTPQKKDEYMDRLLKFIPADVITCYAFVQGFISKLPTPEKIKTVQWIVFIVFCILTPLYLWKLKIHKIQQLVISLLAFIIWVYTIGGPFASLSWYDVLYGSIILPIFTFGVAFIEPEN